MYLPDCWFKYASISSFGSLYEKACNITRNCFRHCCYNIGYSNKSKQTNDRPIIWTTEYGELSSRYTHYLGGVGRFFIYALERRDQKHNKQEQKIAEHYHKLILEFSDKLDKVNTSDFTWSSFFESFEYSKEFRQHLLTGHPELWELLNRVIESERAAELSFKAISEKVRVRIIKKAKELEIPIPKKKNDDPSFNDDYISKIIVEEYDLSSNDNIVYKDTGEHSAELKSKLLDLHSFDYHLAVKFIIKLNEITDDASIHEGIDNYRDIRKTKGENTIKFTELLKDLLTGISLSATVLGGACDHCLNLHDKKDIRRLKPLLSQIPE